MMGLVVKGMADPQRPQGSGLLKRQARPEATGALPEDLPGFYAKRGHPKEGLGKSSIQYILQKYFCAQVSIYKNMCVYIYIVYIIITVCCV